MKAYKVVKELNGKYFSCGSGLDEHHALVLEYKEGEITIAWEGTVGIFLFQTLQDARNYIDNLMTNKYLIFEVESLSPMNIPKKVISFLNFLKCYMIDIKSYNSNLSSRYNGEYYDYSVPKGTRVCKKIRVLTTVYKWGGEE